MLQLDSLRHLRSADDLADLYRQLGYPAEQDVSANTPDEIGMEGAAASDAVRVYLLVDLDDGAGSLQHVHFETRDLNSATLRRITEGFLKRPGEYLLSFTEAARPFERLIFVKSRRDAGGVKMSRLTVQPSRPTAHDRSVLNEIELKVGMGALAAHKKQADAFNIERVTKVFYREYHKLFVHVRTTIKAENRNVQIGPLAKNTTADDASLHAFTQRLLGRIIFLYFIQKKGWLNHNADFITDLYKQVTRHDGSNFYRDALEELFFNVLNTPRPGNESALGEVPYLNGSLFEREYPLTTTMNLPNGLFDPALDGSILHTLGSYNFTVNESGALEQDVSLDPEMLGKVFENMMEKGEAAESGTFYTPRSIVQFMVEETLTRYLEDTTGIPQARLLPLCADDSEAHDLTGDEANTIIAALAKVRVLDPAVGTASMLVGFLNAMIRVRRSAAARRGTTVSEGSLELAKWKREYIQHCLYGVDIKHEAIEIARLRLWLSLVVDAQEAEPLPNLDYKLMAGDGLLETVDGTPFIKDQGGLLGGAGELSAKAAEIEREHERFFAEENPARRSEQRERIQQLERELFKLDIDARIERLQALLDSLTRQIADPRQGEAAHKKAVEKYTELAQQMNPLMKQKTKVLDEKEPLPFFLHNVHFAEVMKGNTGRQLEGFDIVIGNPPYVSINDMDESKKGALKTAFPDVESGRADLYVYFYNKALNLARNNGIVCLITSNKFVKAVYGKNLRSFLESNMSLDLIINFGDLPIFDAAAYPIILSGTKSNKSKLTMKLTTESDIKQFINFKSGQSTESIHDKLSSFNDYIRELGAIINESDFFDGDWLIDSSESLKIISKMNSVGQHLSIIVNNHIHRGIISGNNKVFLLSESEKAQMVKDYPGESDAIIPIIRGKDIVRWGGNRLLKYVIFSNRGFKIEKYPGIHSRLKDYYADLMSRSTIKTHAWYELTQPQEGIYGKFKEKKIVYPDISPTARFSLDETGAYIDSTAFMIASDKKWLLALLNSRLINYYLRNKTNKVMGGALRYKTNYIKKLPIVVPTLEQITLLESFTDDFFLDELNALVYEMYGLTSAEIKLVERLTDGAYAAGDVDVGKLEDEDVEAVEE